MKSLTCLFYGSNVGYAIAPLETLFYQTALRLAEGDESQVHFAYPSYEKGHPESLPDDFKNLLEFDAKCASAENYRRMAELVEENGIELVILFDIQPVFPLYRYLRKAGVKTILSYYGAPISSIMPLWKLMLKRLEVRLSRSKVDGLIFESHAMANFAIYGRGVPRSMIDIVPLGIDIRKFCTTPTKDPYELFGIERGRKIIFYSGHMEERKGVHVLIDAAMTLLHKEKRGDVSFLICGNKAGESDRLKGMYEGLGIEQHIHFAGYRDDIPQFLPACFAGVIPSTGWDSYPRSMLEMAACGLPVIASRLGGIPEGVLDKRTGVLFPPGDSSALALAITALLEDPQKTAEYAKAGRVRCVQELSLEAQCDKFYEVVARRCSYTD